jgi:anti-sigma regulatory factor (Ser/Thr protein kinase)
MSLEKRFGEVFRTRSKPTLAGGRAVDKPIPTMPIRGLGGTLIKKFTDRFTVKRNALTRQPGQSWQ